MSWQALCACGIVVILAAVQLQHTADASMYTYAQISALASQFESAVHAAHDGAPPAPTPEQCDALSAAFTPDAQVLSAGYAMTPDEFCHVWDGIVSDHRTDFSSRQVASVVLPGAQQTVSWWVVDEGVTSAPQNCTFSIPNVAWARVSGSQGLLFDYLEFVTDSKAECFS